MKKNMKILMVSDSFYPIIGGRENVVHNLMLELNKTSSVLLLTSTFKGQTASFDGDEKLPYRVVRCKSLRITKNEYLSILNKKVKKEINEWSEGGIDLIHTQTKYALTKYALKLGKKLNVPVITTAHTNYLAQYKNQLKIPFIYNIFLRHVKKVMNKCFRVITISNHMKSLLCGMGVKTPISVIPNGNDLEPFKNLDFDKSKIYSKYNINANLPVFIFVGRITETKNLSFLFNALSIVKTKGINFNMLIVGGGEIEKYTSITNALNLNENCIFTGPITDRNELASLYKISTLNLFPSVGESFGLTIRESAVMGTPSVTIENTAPSEDIVHNVNGFISKNTNSDFADTIISALQNQENLKAVSNNCITSLGETWASIRDKHIQEYENIIEEYKKTLPV